MEHLTLRTRTPLTISPTIRKLCKNLGSVDTPIFADVQPNDGAVINECFLNVERRVAAAGGTRLCGWQIWEYPNVLVKAEFHAVWQSDSEDVVDVTPKAQE